MLSIPKGQKEKFIILMVWYRIAWYQYRFVSISIVSRHKKNKSYTSLALNTI